MRIAPDRSRLRIVALVCWSLGLWWLVQSPLLALARQPAMLGIGGMLVAILCLALGCAFWLLATDRRAGVTFERKGLSLQLGHSSAFISWENIAAVGVTSTRVSLLALGSQAQLGIRLHNPEQYLQTYEVRVPASPGPLGHAVRLVAQLVGSGRGAAAPGFETVAMLRRRTGYDLLVPEAQLGARAGAFVALLEAYRASPERRRTLPGAYGK